MFDDIPKNLEIFSVRGVNKCDVVFRPLHRIHISICVCYTVYDIRYVKTITRVRVGT